MRRYNQGWRQESERHSLASRGVKTGTMKMMPTREYKAATFRDKSIRATVNIKLPDGTFIQRVPTYHAFGNFQMMTVKYDGKEYLINEGDEYLRGEPEFYELRKELGKNKKPLAAKGKKAVNKKNISIIQHRCQMCGSNNLQRVNGFEECRDCGYNNYGVDA